MSRVAPRRRWSLRRRLALAVVGLLAAVSIVIGAVSVIALQGFLMSRLDDQTRSQYRALGLSTVAFTVCFAVWTIFSIIGVALKDQLGLTETEVGLLVGTPVLSGSLLRIVLGIWTDRYGGRLVYTVTMLAAAVATALLVLAQTYEQFLLAALRVGIAGGSFAVRLPARPSSPWKADFTSTRATHSSRSRCQCG